MAGIGVGISLIVLTKWSFLNPSDPLFGQDLLIQLAFLAGVGLMAGLVLGSGWISKFVVGIYLAMAAPGHAFLFGWFLEGRTRVHNVFVVFVGMGSLLLLLILWIPFKMAGEALGAPKDGD